MSSKVDNKLPAHFRTQKSAEAPAKLTRAGSKRKEADASAELQAQLQTAGGNGAVDIDVSADERCLRQFDLATKYGPCVGMTRLERWERAERFGLAPPKEVRDMVFRLGGPGASADQSLWHHRV